MRKLTQQQFLNNCHDTHGSTYDYSKTIYKNKRTKVSITCKIHGDFTQTPDAHTHQKQGCPKCRNIKAGDAQRGVLRRTPKQHLQDFNKVHGDRYEYPNIEGIGVCDYINITCTKHGVFSQQIHAHKAGRGCPFCGRTTNMTDGDVLYLIRVSGMDIYKIGITSKRLGNRRMVKLKCESKLKLEKVCEIETIDAEAIEAQILTMGYDAGLKGFSGSSEFRYFTEDELSDVLSFFKLNT